MEIEVEVRSLISEEEYNRLTEFMENNAKFLGEDEQVTYYFSGEEDLRLQKGNRYSKVWMKRGKIHDEHREEVEVRFKSEDFEKMLRIFKALGFEVAVKWFRHRKEFELQGVSVMLDHTRGYGHIIELEKMAEEEDKDEVYRMLESRLRSLGVDITPRSEFERKFRHYVDNWEDLTKGQR